MTTQRREGVTARRPLGAPSTVADPITRLLSAFLDGRSPHTQDVYRRDLDDFYGFLRRHRLADPNPIGQRAQHAAALRWFLNRTPGRANELALHYQNDLTARHKSTGTIARRLSTLKSFVKCARVTGIIAWAIEIKNPRVERSRDTRGPSLDTI